MMRFGVVIPTKNSMLYLPAHLECLAAWIDLAAQVVVVDSYSTDGTLDYIRTHLRHPNLSIVSHPPGLYASWNHGIAQLTTDYCYISTVGDSITRPGVEHLVATAERLQCDVLVSMPHFIDAKGVPCKGSQWPFDPLLQQLMEPRLIPPFLVIAAALVCTGEALTGSCASDLFRTIMLQQHPFPTNFGTAGDGAWSLQNATRLRWAITPQKFTAFRIHPTGASASEVQDGKCAVTLGALAAQVANEWLCADGRTAPHSLKIRELLALSVLHEPLRQKHNANRKSWWPWVLNPMAWQTRKSRNQVRFQLAKLFAAISKTAL